MCGGCSAPAAAVQSVRPDELCFNVVKGHDAFVNSVAKMAHGCLAGLQEEQVLPCEITCICNPNMPNAELPDLMMVYTKSHIDFCLCLQSNLQMSGQKLLGSKMSPG